MGYQVSPQVGCAGFYIDIGVVHPERPGEYMLGIECDGAQYHSSRAARDRDRLRQQVLEQRGWRIHRIWSTSWYKQKQAEIKRLWQALKQSLDAPDDSEPPAVAYDDLEPSINSLCEENITSSHHANDVKSLDAILPSYTCAQLVASSKLVDWLQSGEHTADLSTLVVQVATVEAPIHLEEVITRIRTAAGFARAGSRIRHNILQAVDYAQRMKKIVVDGHFIWTLPKRKPVPRSHSKMPNASRKVEYIHPAEVQEAVLHTVQSVFGIEETELCNILFRVFGFNQVNSDMRRLAEQVVKELIRQQRLLRDHDGILRIP